MEHQEQIKNQETQNIESQLQQLESEPQFIQNNADFSTLQQPPVEVPKKKKTVKKSLCRNYISGLNLNYRFSSCQLFK